jgi:hypothetical protein
MPPGAADDQETGLIVGHIQSGKTVSFTTVAALCRDNGYGLVIVVTGTSTPLSRQSVTRLERDLRLQTRSDWKWRHIHNPRQRDAQAIADCVANWRDKSVPAAARQTLLITVMKQHQHLRNLTAALRGVSLAGVPALVIDDEADQAGLNNLVNQGGQSTTYQRLVELRQLLPHQTYIQYTATPQAPLLINLIDVLSPSFAEVLTPGTDYVGGREFFVSHRDLVRVIPAGEIFTRTTSLSEPPQSLLEAMRVFFLGVAAGWVKDEGHGNRSMMVHPSQHRKLHTEYTQWVGEIKSDWDRVLGLLETDSDYIEFVEELRPAYADLQGTVSDLSSFEDLLKELRHAVRATRVTTVNAAGGSTPQVDWRSTYSHILVGGQAMDRGFTVSGLTVTYMPRGVGVGNADTVQQRARFFGYKRDYLGYCRIWLEAAARDAYERYVRHEDDLRERLTEHRRSGKPLTEWKRAFFLDPRLQPTRDTVLDIDYVQGSMSNEWFDPSAPHESADAVESNRAVVRDFLSLLDLRPDETGRHDVADGVRLAEAYERLLIRLRMTRSSDSVRYTGLLLQVKKHLESHPDSVCRIYQMSRGTARERALTDTGTVNQLFQGPSGSTYPGDRELKANEGMTIQLHTLNLTKDSRLQHENVPEVAVWVPTEMSRGWLVQDQG